MNWKNVARNGWYEVLTDVLLPCNMSLWNSSRSKWRWCRHEIQFIDDSSYTIFSRPLYAGSIAPTL
jgi:hypothetical protein